MNSQFEYTDYREGFIFIVKFNPPSDKKICLTCRYLTSPISSPPLYSVLIEHDNQQILWNTMKTGLDFLSDDVKNYIDRLFKLKILW